MMLSSTPGAGTWRDSYSSGNQADEIELFCAALAETGAPAKVVGNFRKILVEAGTWRASAQAYPANVMKAIMGLALKGFPGLAGEPMVFPFDFTAAALGGVNELLLKPRKPVWAIGLVIDSILPLGVGPIVTTAFEYAGDQIYPSAGEDQNGFVRVKGIETFTFPALDADASPWPMGLLLNDELSLRISVTNNDAVNAARFRGNVYAVSLKEGPGYKALVDEVKKATK